MSPPTARDMDIPDWKGAAVEPLYAALNDEQKKTADELLMGPMGMMI